MKKTVLAAALFIAGCGDSPKDAERWARREGFTPTSGGFAGFIETQASRNVGGSSLHFYAYARREYVSDAASDHRVRWVIPNVLIVSEDGDPNAAREALVVLADHLMAHVKGSRLCASARAALLHPERWGREFRKMHPCDDVHAVSMKRVGESAYRLSVVIAASPSREAPPELLF